MTSADSHSRPPNSIDEAVSSLLAALGSTTIRDVDLARAVREKIERASLDVLDLELTDLALATACELGDPAAHRALSRYAGELAPVVRSRTAHATPDDAWQLVLERVLVPRPDGPPRIALYRGEGPLGAWLRIVMTRLLYDARPRGPETADDFDVLAAAADTLGPELQAMRHEGRALLRQSLAHALAKLTSREVNLLRYRYIDNLGPTEVARIYRAHRATVTRWYDEAHTRLRLELKRAITDELRLSDSDVESLVRATWSGIDISIARMLQRP